MQSDVAGRINPVVLLTAGVLAALAMACGYLLAVDVRVLSLATVGIGWLVLRPYHSPLAVYLSTLTFGTALIVPFFPGRPYVWELASLVGKLSRRPAIGTLHDHPIATFISRKRQCLMRWCAAFGLAKVACVSVAVRDACAAAGYLAGKLTVIHNGLPPTNFPPSVRSGIACRFGFLRAFSGRKGLRGLFEIADRIEKNTHSAWELHIAGEAQDEAGRQLVGELRARHESKPWWPRVHWHGWVGQPQAFLSQLDLLIVPSSGFDPLPTVLLEAGQIGVPVLVAPVGGVAEVIRDGDTGWLFDVGDWMAAANTANRFVF